MDPKRAKTAFRALTRLCVGKKVTLHVPEFVKREFQSQQKVSVEDEIHKIVHAARSITRLSLNPKLVAFSEEISEAAEKILPKAGTHTADEFTKWTKKCDAKESKIEAEHAVRVIDDYFAGAVPFASTKNRTDIPDSFIWQTVCDLAKEKTRLHFVAQDGALFKAAASLKNVTAYHTLDAFIESPECQKAIQLLPSEVVANNIDRAKRIIPKHEKALADMVESGIINALSYQTIYDVHINDENGEALITSVGSPEDLTFDFENIEYFGGNELGVHFNATIECELNYAMYIGEFFGLSDEAQARMSTSPLNDQYFDVDETHRLAVVGTLSLELEKSVLDNEKSDDVHIEDAILESEVKVEITKKKIAREVG
jgi:hypothetical protein